MISTLRSTLVQRIKYGGAKWFKYQVLLFAGYRTKKAAIVVECRLEISITLFNSEILEVIMKGKAEERGRNKHEMLYNFTKSILIIF